VVPPLLPRLPLEGSPDRGQDSACGQAALARHTLTYYLT
jgi:hypothetical protein